jgi:hypothetical protein
MSWFNNLKARIKLTLLKPFKYKSILDWYDNADVGKSLNLELTDNQRLVLASYYGLPLTSDQQDIIEQWQTDNKTTYKEQQNHNALVLEAGRCSGKDLLLTLICFYEFECLCYKHRWSRVFSLADQPKQVLYITPNVLNGFKPKKFIQYMPYTQKLILKGLADLTESKLVTFDGISLQAVSTKKSDLYGYQNLHLVAFSEGARDERVLDLWYRLRKTDTKLVIAGSAHAANDVLSRLYKEAQKEDDYLGFRLPTWDLSKLMNRNNPVVVSEYTASPKFAALSFEGIRG